VIFLDYQSTTPMAPEAQQAMLPWLSAEGSANPHSTHVAGRAAKAAIEVARDEIAALMPPGGRIVFTSGATEAANMALRGVGAGGIALPDTEHAAVRDTALWLRQRGHDVTLWPVDRDGMAIDVAIKPGTRIVAAMLVNNEIGVIQPIATLARQAYAAGSLMFCDAVQGYGRIAVPHECDMVAISAHKIHGPKGIGALWIRDGIELEPLIHGGGQELGLRSGTLSPALCAGFGVAARLMHQRQGVDSAHVDRLWRIALDALGPEWRINGARDPRYKGNLNIRRDGLDTAQILSSLRNVGVSAGSACASGSGRPSHVLTALGLSDAEARSSLRIGFGRYTEPDALLAGLNAISAAADAQLERAA
jgi:cysteine desulfurase